MGLFDSLFDSKSKSKNYLQPWDKTASYLAGDENQGITGIPQDAYSLYGRSGWNDQMQHGADLFQQQLGQQYGDIPTIRKSIFDVGKGDLDPIFGKVNDISGVDRVRNIPGVNDVARILGVDHVTGGNARALQGEVDPTNALKSILSGEVNTKYLDPLAQSITTQINRNFGENALPQIRGGAIASGQYGGSRQGIAEGLALSRLNQDLATGISPIYANAFENAQNRMAGTAESLDSRAASMAIQNALNDLNTQQFNAGIDAGNADRRLNTQQFNANLGLQNNQQQLGAQQFNANLGLNRNQQALGFSNAQLNNRLAAFNALGVENDREANMYQQYINSLMGPQTADQGALANYYNMIVPLSQVFGTTRGKNTQSPGIVPAILGTAAGIGGLASGMGMLGKAGGAMGGLTNFQQGMQSFAPIGGGMQAIGMPPLIPFYR